MGSSRSNVRSKIASEVKEAVDTIKSRRLPHTKVEAVIRKYTKGRNMGALYPAFTSREKNLLDEVTKILLSVDGKKISKDAWPFIHAHKVLYDIYYYKGNNMLIRFLYKIKKYDLS